MAIAVNKNTNQKPMTAVGRTGAQTLKFIPGARVYTKVADSIASTPVQAYFTKSNGTTPAGWTDLGTVLGAVKVNYTKTVKEVTTGIDDYFRAAYVDKKVGQIEFELSQLDDVTLETISGLTASVITSGSVINYQVGSEDLNLLALLVVATSKLDSKEIQFYNPSAYLNFTWAEQGDALVLKVTGLLPFFTATGASAEGMLSVTEFA
jgi:hypothetical protein